MSCVLHLIPLRFSISFNSLKIPEWYFSVSLIGFSNSDKVGDWLFLKGHRGCSAATDFYEEGDPGPPVDRGEWQHAGPRGSGLQDALCSLTWGMPAGLHSAQGLIIIRKTVPWTCLCPLGLEALEHFLESHFVPLGCLLLPLVTASTCSWFSLWVNDSAWLGIHNLWLPNEPDHIVTQGHVPQPKSNHLRGQSYISKHNTYLFSMSRIINSSSTTKNKHVPGFKTFGKGSTEIRQNPSSFLTRISLLSLSPGRNIMGMFMAKREDSLKCFWSKCRYYSGPTLLLPKDVLAGCWSYFFVHEQWINVFKTCITERKTKPKQDEISRKFKGKKKLQPPTNDPRFGWDN